jgi:hypothetical protein
LCTASTLFSFLCTDVVVVTSAHTSAASAACASCVLFIASYLRYVLG